MLTDLYIEALLVDEELAVYVMLQIVRFVDSLNTVAITITNKFHKCNDVQCLTIPV